MVRGVRFLVRLGLAIAILSGVMAGQLMADINPVIGLFLGYSRAVNTVALSANGRHALSGGQDNVLRLWDIPTGLLLRTFDAQASRINAVAFSPDGYQILSGGGDKLIRIWAVTTGQAVRTLEGHAGAVLSGAFSPDGKRALSASADKTIKLWDVETGDLLRTFEGHSDEVLSVAFSSDGHKALSASKDKTLKLWDLETGQLLTTLEGHADAVTSAALSADGAEALSGSKDRTIKLWDLASGKSLKTFEGHSDEVLRVALSSDGRVLSAGKDKMLKLWDLKTGELIKTFEGHSDSVTSAVFSPDGQSALSGSSDKTLKLWDLQTGQLENTIDLQSTTFWPSGYRNFFSGVSVTKRADPALVEERLKEKGLKRGAPVFLRIFKGDLEVELWMKRGDRYELFATYPICAWSGQLGPKVREGDLQAPEGFYAIGKSQLNPNSHYHRAFNLGYPNDLDRAHNRTGANLMIHGGCGSVGCFAMTDAEIDELWLLVTAALDSGQERMPVHVFPFRMTDERMAAFAWHPWAEFWRDMKPAYDFSKKAMCRRGSASATSAIAFRGERKGAGHLCHSPNVQQGGVVRFRFPDDQLFCRVSRIGRRGRNGLNTAPKSVEDGPFAFIGRERRIDRDTSKVLGIFDGAKTRYNAVETVLDRLDVGPVIILVVIISRNAHEPFATAGSRRRQCHGKVLGPGRDQLLEGGRGRQTGVIGHNSDLVRVPANLAQKPQVPVRILGRLPRYWRRKGCNREGAAADGLFHLPKKLKVIRCSA